jgi:hypothetical protein
MAQTPDLSRHEIESEFAVRNAPPASLYEVRRLIASAIANRLIRPDFRMQGKNRLHDGPIEHNCHTSPSRSTAARSPKGRIPGSIRLSFANHSFARVTRQLCLPKLARFKN